MHWYWKLVVNRFVKGGRLREVVEMLFRHDPETGREWFTGEVRAEMIPIAARNVS